MEIRALSRQEKLFWLRLIRSDGIGPLTFFQLISRFGSAENAVNALPDLIGKKGTKRIRLSKSHEVQDEFEKIEGLGAALIAFPDPAFPPALRAIPDPPPLITVIGDEKLLPRPSISIVGARNASAAGQHMAKQLASELGQNGFVIVSGLARGIDGAAHLSSLTHGTIAVLAGGADQIYPPEHTQLYHQITELGAIVSEVRLGHVAKAKDFPKRNRIVSGLSQGVIVVEAAERSGTLITARMGLEQGREIFAVPGSPLDPRSEGTNRLIRNGATLIRSASDVIDGLGPLNAAAFENDHLKPYNVVSSSPTEIERTELRLQILDLLSFTPTHKDVIVRMVEAPPAYIADALLDLTFSEEVSEVPGGSYVLSSADKRFET